MDNPQVTLISASYNYGRYIGQMIQSVIDQTYTNWELIIADDGSQDNSVEIACSFDDPRITVLLSGSNQGASRALNRAYSRARGKYVGNVDADDYLAPEKLEKQVAYMEAHPEVAVLGTYIVQIDEDGRQVEGRSTYWNNQCRDLNDIENWSFGPFVNALSHSTVLMRKASKDRVGHLNPDMKYAYDFELWLRFVVLGYRFHVLPERLTYYRVHSANLSSTSGSKTFFLELTYLYCAYLAGHLIRLNRPDLIDKALTFFVDYFFRNSGASPKVELIEALGKFPLYPADFPSFKAQFETGPYAHLLDEALIPPASSATDWPALIRQADRTAVAAKRPPKLVIVDDYFPNLSTSFRIHEFNYYLARLDCEVRSTLGQLLSTSGDFQHEWQRYASFYPQFKQQVKPFEAGQPLDGSLLYSVFINNAYLLLPAIEAQKLPFVFGLYPGGGLQLNNGVCDLKLYKLGNSRYLQKMIVTQPIIYDYVLAGGFCPPEKVELIYGVVLPAEYYKHHRQPKCYYPHDKATFDICFVAMKYMPLGQDKGYDTFIAVARELARLSPAFRFHVAGGFGPEEIEVGSLGDTITFYGLHPSHFFPQFYASMDLFISPNVPSILFPGGFDSFPTGCATDAGLCGVAVMCTDQLEQNRHFAAGEEIAIVSHQVSEIVERVMEYYQDPARLYALARAGQARFEEVYSEQNQLVRRLELLSRFL